MNTPAHVLFAAAVWARPGEPKVTLAALAGALMPDLSLYLLAGVSLFVLGLSPNHVFDDLYFSPAWQTVFAVDNSFILWGTLFALAWWQGWRLAQVFSAAALLHLAFDFPLHHDDGRPHFWPVSDWVFESPVSYWDQAHHAGVIGPIEIAVSLVICVVLFLRFSGPWARLAVMGAAAVQVAPGLIWMLVFS